MVKIYIYIPTYVKHFQLRRIFNGFNRPLFFISIIVEKLLQFGLADKRSMIDATLCSIKSQNPFICRNTMMTLQLSGVRVKKRLKSNVAERTEQTLFLERM